jgi:hypothetical protein
VDTKSVPTKQIKLVANETLSTFETIAEAAIHRLRESHTLGPQVLAGVNILTSETALQRLREIGRANIDGYCILAEEPAIARVTVLDETSASRTYYICRAAPLTEVPNLASYRSPVGRLASLPLGGELRLPNGEVVVVQERVQLRPVSSSEGWDSRDTVLEAEDLGPMTIESLRALLREVPAIATPEALLEQLLAEAAEKANIIEGRRRAVLTKMGLRDQPILDQYQDEIFRLPLDKRLLILGPPGTGKTTTLIRRLGQKLDPAFLDEEEHRLVESTKALQGVSHPDSWLMFTPTELLKQYLKEAFARERVPASDLRISTWAEYRRLLARNVFGVLRTASTRGTFVLKESTAHLSPNTLVRAIDWFTEFDSWQRASYLADLRESAEILAKARSASIAELGARLTGFVTRADEKMPATALSALVAETDKVQALLLELRTASDAKIRGALTVQLNHDREFLDHLASYLDTLEEPQMPDGDDSDDDDGDQDEEDEEISGPRTGRAAAVTGYLRAIRAQARAAAAKRSLSKGSRVAKVTAWLENRTLAQADLVDVGNSLLLQARLRRFVNPVKRYIDGVPRRYRRYRRERRETAIWYTKSELERRDIHALELDVVLLAMLREADEMLRTPSIIRSIESSQWSALKPTLGLYRNQVLVDEATDFSPIQLAAMATLADPRVRSFFACGDFNQRLTLWGARSAAELKWILPDLEVKEITVSYRQTRQLNDFARALIRATGGADQQVSLPNNVDSEGVAPALLETGDELPSVVSWLAERIREIERFVKQLPSTAIFVNTEDDVRPLAEALSAALSEQNIQVVPCLEGQAVGQDNDVRVFDIRHIKGLEFEAVFYVSIDQLAVSQPELFDKYLYVGTTRAATYLGVTCTKTLPAVIESLRSHFVGTWSLE